MNTFFDVTERGYLQNELSGGFLQSLPQIEWWKKTRTNGLMSEKGAFEQPDAYHIKLQ